MKNFLTVVLLALAMLVGIGCGNSKKSNSGSGSSGSSTSWSGNYVGAVAWADGAATWQTTIIIGGSGPQYAISGTSSNGIPSNLTGSFSATGTTSTGLKITGSQGAGINEAAVLSPAGAYLVLSGTTITYYPNPGSMVPSVLTLQ